MTIGATRETRCTTCGCGDGDRMTDDSMSGYKGVDCRGPDNYIQKES